MRSRPELLALALSLASCSDEQVGTDSTDGTSSAAASSSGAGAPTTGSTSGTWSSLDERPCPEDSFLTAENFGAGFLLTHCTGCHHSALATDERAGAPLGVDFDKLGLVRTQAAQIWLRAGDQNATMPPLGPPPAEERARLGEWLACGAPTDADLE